jgi:anti-sigma-K factor RskA
MSRERHVQELLAAYVLGTLEPDDARRVDEHLPACWLCRQELDELAGVADVLAFSVPAAEPSPEVKERLMRRVRASLPPDRQAPARPAGPPARQRALLRVPAWGWAGLGLVLVLLASNLALWVRLQRLETITAPGGMRAVALAAAPAVPQATGFVVIGADGRNGALVVDRLPPLAAGQEYQVWLQRDGQQTSGGVFTTDESGYRGLRLEAPLSLFEYSRLGITIEPTGGSTQPTGTLVLGGPLFNR